MAEWLATLTAGGLGRIFFAILELASNRQVRASDAQMKERFLIGRMSARGGRACAICGLDAWEEAYLESSDLMQRLARLFSRDELVTSERFCGDNVNRIHSGQGNRFGLRHCRRHQGLIGLAPLAHLLEESR